MSAVLVGYEGVMERIKAIADRKALEAVAVRAFRSTLFKVKAQALSEAKTRGVLKEIATRNPPWFRSLIQVGKVERIGGDFQARIKLVGLATIQETGGRIKAHKIRAKTAARMVFMVGGHWRSGKEVKHPGATHPAMPFFEPAVARTTPTMIEEVRKAMEDHLAKAARGITE